MYIILLVVWILIAHLSANLYSGWFTYSLSHSLVKIFGSCASAGCKLTTRLSPLSSFFSSTLAYSLLTASYYTCSYVSCKLVSRHPLEVACACLITQPIVFMHAKENQTKCACIVTILVVPSNSQKKKNSEHVTNCDACMQREN